MRGRVLLHLHETAARVFAEGLSEANSWTGCQWNGELNFLREIQGCVRMAVGMGHDKIDYLDKIPYLFGRLGQPGVRDRVIAQWKSAPAARHAPLSIEFLGHAGDLCIYTHTV